MSAALFPHFLSIDLISPFQRLPWQDSHVAVHWLDIRTVRSANDPLAGRQLGVVYGRHLGAHLDLSLLSVLHDRVAKVVGQPKTVRKVCPDVEQNRHDQQEGCAIFRGFLEGGLWTDERGENVRNDVPVQSLATV